LPSRYVDIDKVKQPNKVEEQIHIYESTAMANSKVKGELPYLKEWAARLCGLRLASQINKAQNKTVERLQSQNEINYPLENPTYNSNITYKHYITPRNKVEEFYKRPTKHKTKERCHLHTKYSGPSLMKIFSNTLSSVQYFTRFFHFLTPKTKPCSQSKPAPFTARSDVIKITKAMLEV